MDKIQVHSNVKSRRVGSVSGASPLTKSGSHGNNDDEPDPDPLGVPVPVLEDAFGVADFWLLNKTKRKDELFIITRKFMHPSIEFLNIKWRLKKKKDGVLDHFPDKNGEKEIISNV